MKKTLIATLMAASFGMAASASAGEISDTFNIVYEVPAACAMLIEQKNVDLEMGFTAGSEIDTSASAVQPIKVVCNNQLAYTLEFPNARNGGVIKLGGATTGAELDLYAKIDNVAFGSQANSEARTLTGSGTVQTVNVGLSLAPDVVPTVDTYSATVDVKLSF